MAPVGPMSAATREACIGPDNTLVSESSLDVPGGYPVMIGYRVQQELGNRPSVLRFAAGVTGVAPALKSFS